AAFFMGILCSSCDFLPINIIKPYNSFPRSSWGQNNRSSNQFDDLVIGHCLYVGFAYVFLYLRCTTINFSRDPLDVYYDFKSENELDKLYQFLTFDDCFWFFTFNLIFLWLGRCLMASSFYCIIWLSCLHRDVTHRQPKFYDPAYA